MGQLDRQADGGRSVAIDCKSGVPAKAFVAGVEGAARARDGDKKTLEHMVSAWANSNNLVLGQLTDDILAVKEPSFTCWKTCAIRSKCCPGNGRRRGGLRPWARGELLPHHPHRLNLLKQTPQKVGIKGKRIKAGWTNDYLLTY